MRHRCHLKIAPGDLLHLAIGRVIVDPVDIPPEPVTGMEHGLVLVGLHCQIVQPPARDFAHCIKMGGEVIELILRQSIGAAGFGIDGRSRRSSGQRNPARSGHCRIHTGADAGIVFRLLRRIERAHGLWFPAEYHFTRRSPMRRRKSRRFALVRQGQQAKTRREANG